MSKNVEFCKKILYNVAVQFKILQLLEQEGNYQEILEIGNRKLFENNPLIQEEILKVAIEREDFETVKKIEETIL